jgi:outer membrane immunogenic protein
MLDPKWFAGVEGDIGYLGLDRTVADWNDSANHITFSQNAGWYGTIRGRAGATTGPALLYLTGGVAWVRVRDGLTNPGCFLCGTVSEVTTRTASGWTFGGGTEVALGMRLSAKLEYLYMDVGRSVLTDGSTWDAEFHNRFQIVRAGLNYKLGD